MGFTKRKLAKPKNCDDFDMLFLEREPKNPFLEFMHDTHLEPIWKQREAEILAAWVRDQPGTRPHYWWKFSAPERLRNRLGGAGDTMFPFTEHGLPTSWTTTRDAEAYTKIRVPFTKRPVDPDDPPRFESEATYLQRHGLFLPGEQERLNDEDFQPETIGVENDE